MCSARFTRYRPHRAGDGRDGLIILIIVSTLHVHLKGLINAISQVYYHDNRLATYWFWYWCVLDTLKICIKHKYYFAQKKELDLNPTDQDKMSGHSFCGKFRNVQSRSKISALLSDNAPLLPENCCNYKCFGIHVYLFCLHWKNHKKSEGKKSQIWYHDIIPHRTGSQKWTGQNYWHPEVNIW